VRQKFTGYQKDDETGLDFAEARMYQNLHGRFTAVDPLLASGKSADPQTFNRYVYVLNNPPILTDPAGLQAGTWYESKDGDYIYHYPWNKLPAGYSELTRTSRAGELISDPTGRTHVYRFNPNGPATNPRDPTILLTGLKALVYSDYDFKGYDLIATDAYEETHPSSIQLMGIPVALKWRLLHWRSRRFSRHLELLVLLSRLLLRQGYPPCLSDAVNYTLHLTLSVSE
jgi:RHS repeat-associated protein